MGKNHWFWRLVDLVSAAMRLLAILDKLRGPDDLMQ